MDTIRVLHMSDTHLGYAQYGLAEREDDIYEAFSEAVETALRERVDLVVHSGDFFDTAKPPAQAIRHAARELRRLRDAGIPVVAVLGDHDYTRRRVLPPLALLADPSLGSLVRLVGARGFETVRVRGRSGAPVEVAGSRNVKGVGARQQLLAGLEKLRPSRDTASILVLHEGLREAIGPEYELELGDLPRGFSYYALGHVHLRRGWRLGDSYAVYPGSIEALRRDEARQQQERYIVIAELAPGRTVGLEWVKLESTRPQPVVEIEYSDMASFKSYLADLRRKLASYRKKPLVHIAVKGAPRRDRKQLRSLIETALRGVTLSHRVSFEEDAGSEAGSMLHVARHISVEAMLRERLRDERLVELAQLLMEVLGQEARKSEAANHALRIIRERYGLED